MALTKVTGGVIDLNQDNADTVFQMPAGAGGYSGTPVNGMIRYNSSLPGFEFYNGTEWSKLKTPSAAEVDFLVSAGGGSGGSDKGGGGGGAGGLRTSYGDISGGGSSLQSALSLTSGTTYTITVGAGGAGAPNGQPNGRGGTSSLIGGSISVSCTGGGKGGGNNNSTSFNGNNNWFGEDGGCGGGNGLAGDAQGNRQSSGTTGEGYPGALTSSSYHSGGGGGVGSAGETQRHNLWNGGGLGLSIAITTEPITYGKGGDAANNATYDSQPQAPSGDANTGTGGTGSGNGSMISGSGGSGVVILRMPTSIYSGTTTGSPTVTTAGTDTILKYTGSGTYTH